MSARCRIENGKDRYVLFAEVGPQGDITATFPLCTGIQQGRSKADGTKNKLVSGNARP